MIGAAGNDSDAFVSASWRHRHVITLAWTSAYKSLMIRLWFLASQSSKKLSAEIVPKRSSVESHPPMKNTPFHGPSYVEIPYSTMVSRGMFNIRGKGFLSVPLLSSSLLLPRWSSLLFKGRLDDISQIQWNGVQSYGTPKISPQNCQQMFPLKNPNVGLSENIFPMIYSHLTGIMIINHWVQWGTRHFQTNPCNVA